MSKWTLKNKGREQLRGSIEWEMGIGDEGYIPGEVQYTVPEILDSSKAYTSNGKFLSDQSTLSRWRHMSMTHQLLIYSQRKSTSIRQLLLY